MASKFKLFLTVLAIIGLISCKTNSLQHQPALQPGMFKVAVLYPNGDDKTFDMDYYEKKHMPMMAKLIGDNLNFYEIDKGVAGRSPNERVPFLAVGYFYVKDTAQYNKTIADNRATVVADFKNYTNIQPIVLISEIREVAQRPSK